MTESESVALPLGDAPLCTDRIPFYLRYFIKLSRVWQAFLPPFQNFFQNKTKKDLFPFISLRLSVYDKIKKVVVMLLSYLLDKPVCVGDSPRGTCRGIGVSLRSYSVKLLLCSTSQNRQIPDFAVSTASVLSTENDIQLTRLRAVLPKNCVKLFLGLPIFSAEGAYLGKLIDVEMESFSAVALHTDKKEEIPFSAVAACNDAIILRKMPTYPLGQRIPAPLLCQIQAQNEQLVTKQTLRRAIEQKALIKLTLSLPPFDAAK